MKHLHKLETDQNFKQQLSTLKECHANAVNSYKIAKKYKDDYPNIH